MSNTVYKQAWMLVDVSRNGKHLEVSDKAEFVDGAPDGYSQVNDWLLVKEPTVDGAKLAVLVRMKDALAMAARHFNYYDAQFSSSGHPYNVSDVVEASVVHTLLQK